MKESKKLKRKRSYSSSEDSRQRSESNSSSRRHKHKHKSKKSKKDRKHRSKSSEREGYGDKHQSIRSRVKDEGRGKHQREEKYSSIKKQEHSSYKHENNPSSLQQQNPQAPPQKQQPCFQPSGILLQYYNSRDGVSLRFHQPPQSRQPTQQWRMYIFKGQQVLRNPFTIIEPIMLTNSCYLIGKDQRVADILAENPSISRQHAVVQFRLVQKRQTQGEFVQEIKPYVMDLESTNGTLLNDEKIQPGRYYELLHRDVLKFGFSDREYVLVKWEEPQDQDHEQ